MVYLQQLLIESLHSSIRLNWFLCFGYLRLPRTVNCMKFERYTVNYSHRGKLPLSQKSQWKVSEWEELRLFSSAVTNGWKNTNDQLWSINENFDRLGVDSAGDLFMAKYWQNQNEWHGFPVSSKRNGDRPPSSALKDWVRQKYISKSVASRIAQGKI